MRGLRWSPRPSQTRNEKNEIECGQVTREETWKSCHEVPGNVCSQCSQELGQTCECASANNTYGLHLTIPHHTHTTSHHITPHPHHTIRYAPQKRYIYIRLHYIESHDSIQVPVLDTDVCGSVTNVLCCSNGGFASNAYRFSLCMFSKDEKRCDVQIPSNSHRVEGYSSSGTMTMIDDDIERYTRRMMLDYPK
jgi:hypothetical protein